MAIVSISKIQHRRGLQQDLPQLASAELGWSLDQQKLYIGNGILSEGSPRLGNTEILTEHSDILRLAESYTYLNEDAGYTPTTGGRNNKFNAVAYGNGTYVIVGTNGSILKSADGVSWSPVYGGTTNTLNDIVYGLVGTVGYFVAVGASGTIIYSQDGAVWNNAITSVLLTLTSITYATGTINNFVATSNSGKVIVSSDASLWTVVTTGTSNSLNSISYYNGLVVAVGNNGTILTSSTPGINNAWVSRVCPSSYNLKSVKWNSDRWIIGGEYSTVLYSTNAITWKYSFTDTFRAAANNTGIWVFVGDGGVIYKSSGATGTDLTVTNSITSNNLNDIIFSATDNAFVTVGASGTILTSSTTDLWTAQTSGTTYDLNKIVYDPLNAVYVAVGNNGTIITSTNLANPSAWTLRTSGTTQNLYSIAIWPQSGSLKYVAVGANGTILISSNLTSWQAPSTGITSNFKSIAVASLGGSSYKAIAVGDAGAMASCINVGAGLSSTWSLISTSNVEDLHGINYITWTYNGITSNKFFAVGNNGTVISNDPTVNALWSDRLDVSSANHLFNVYYGIDNFWIVGSVGYSTIYGGDITQSDTITNQSLNLLFNATTGFSGPTITSSSYGLSKYVIVGQYDTVLASSDGQNYVSQPSRPSNWPANLSSADLFDIIFQDSKFLGVGNKGLLLTSSDSILWSGKSYVFGNAKTTRSLQHKLDDFVSVKDFGAKGDGLTDDTESINRALYEIYCKSSNASARKVLHFPGGRYIVSDSIKVPSNAVIRGEGANNTIIQQTADPTYTSYVIITADSLQQIGSQAGYNGATLPSDIIVEDMALESAADGIWLVNASRVTFSRVRMTGGLSFPNVPGNPNVGINLIGAAMSVPTDINFLDCYLEKFNYGVYQYDTEYTRNIRFDSTTFTNMYKGMYLCNGDGQVNTMTISNCVFDNICASAIDANYATNITSTFNSYRDVGNSYHGTGNGATEIIKFGTASIGCASINDQFDRGSTESFSYPWVIGNPTTGAWFGGHELRVGYFAQEGGEIHLLSTGQTNAAISGLTYTINDNSYNQRIQYMIVRDSYTRSGVLQLVYNKTTKAYTIDDESSETGDVGVIFGISSDNTTLSLTYTSTGGSATVFTLAVAERFVKISW